MKKTILTKLTPLAPAVIAAILSSINPPSLTAEEAYNALNDPTLSAAPAYVTAAGDTAGTPAVAAGSAGGPDPDPSIDEEILKIIDSLKTNSVSTKTELDKAIIDYLNLNEAIDGLEKNDDYTTIFDKLNTERETAQIKIDSRIDSWFGVNVNDLLEVYAKAVEPLREEGKYIDLAEVSYETVSNLKTEVPSMGNIRDFMRLVHPEELEAEADSSYKKIFEWVTEEYPEAHSYMETAISSKVIINLDARIAQLDSMKLGFGQLLRYGLIAEEVSEHEADHTETIGDLERAFNDVYSDANETLRENRRILSAHSRNLRKNISNSKKENAYLDVTRNLASLAQIGETIDDSSEFSETVRVNNAHNDLIAAAAGLDDNNFYDERIKEFEVSEGVKVSDLEEKAKGTSTMLSGAYGQFMEEYTTLVNGFLKGKKIGEVASSEEFTTLADDLYHIDRNISGNSEDFDSKAEVEEGYSHLHHQMNAHSLWMESQARNELLKSLEEQLSELYSGKNITGHDVEEGAPEIENNTERLELERIKEQGLKAKAEAVAAKAEYERFKSLDEYAELEGMIDFNEIEAITIHEGIGTEVMERYKQSVIDTTKGFINTGAIENKAGLEAARRVTQEITNNSEDYDGVLSTTTKRTEDVDPESEDYVAGEPSTHTREITETTPLESADLTSRLKLMIDRYQRDNSGNVGASGNMDIDYNTPSIDGWSASIPFNNGPWSGEAGAEVNKDRSNSDIGSSQHVLGQTTKRSGFVGKVEYTDKVGEDESVELTTKVDAHIGTTATSITHDEARRTLGQVPTGLALDPETGQPIVDPETGLPTGELTHGDLGGKSNRTYTEDTMAATIGAEGKLDSKYFRGKFNANVIAGKKDTVRTEQFTRWLPGAEGEQLPLSTTKSGADVLEVLSQLTLEGKLPIGENYILLPAVTGGFLTNFSTIDQAINTKDGFTTSDWVNETQKMLFGQIGGGLGIRGRHGDFTHSTLAAYLFTAGNYTGETDTSLASLNNSEHMITTYEILTLNDLGLLFGGNAQIRNDSISSRVKEDDATLRAAQGNLQQWNPRLLFAYGASQEGLINYAQALAEQSSLESLANHGQALYLPSAPQLDALLMAEVSASIIGPDSAMHSFYPGLGPVGITAGSEGKTFAGRSSLEASLYANITGLIADINGVNPNDVPEVAVMLAYQHFSNQYTIGQVARNEQDTPAILQTAYDESANGLIAIRVSNLSLPSGYKPNPIIQGLTLEVGAKAEGIRWSEGMSLDSIKPCGAIFFRYDLPAE